MSRRVLVTGGAGFAGSHVVDLLVEEGCDVWAWRRADAPADGRSDETRVQWRAVDMFDRGRVTSGLDEARPTEIYHCAGAPHVGSSWNDATGPLATNVLLTHHLLDSLRNLDLHPRVVVPGSAMVYAPSPDPIDEQWRCAPANPYGLSKLAQEMRARRASENDGQAVLLPRAFNHTGARQHPSFAAPSFARQIARIEAGLAPAVMQVGNLDARRDITDVRDTARAYCLIAARGVPGRVYNICTGDARPVRDVLDGLLALTDVRVAIEVDTARLQQNDHPVLAGNPARIVSELGWRPTIPFDRMLADLLDYWRRVASAAADTGHRSLS